MPDDEVAGRYFVVDEFVRVQRFSAQGEPLGEAVDFDDPTAELQHSPVLTTLSDDTLMLSWYGKNHLSVDSSGDIVATTFAVPEISTAPEDGPAVDLALSGASAEGWEIVSIDSSGTIG